MMVHKHTPEKETMMKHLNRMIVIPIIAVLVILSGCKEGPSSTKPSTDPNKPDVVVIGSEIEGVYLAKAAKEGGLSVVILDPREKPGGQLIQGEMLFLDEPQEESGKSLLQGQVKKLFDEYKSGKIRKIGEFQSYYQSLLDGIPLESGISITNLGLDSTSDSSKKKISSLTYRTKDGQEKTLTPSYVVENTDHAALTSKLGLQRIPGIESVFGGSKNYMAATVMMKFRNVDWNRFKQEVHQLSREAIDAKYGSTTTVTDMSTWGFGKVGSSYTPTTNQLFLRGLNIVNQKDGDAAINALLAYNVDPSRAASVNQALEAGKKETDRILQHLRKELPGWEAAEVNGYPNYLYIRDYDRYETEYVLQATDMMGGKMFWDNVSIAGYPIDLQGTQDRVWGFHKGTPDKYGMPLRAFLPKGYANVIVAGKNVGATGAAYGSARIQPNTSLAGEVIGIILGQIKGKYSLSELTESRMKELQKVISQKGIILDSPEGANKIKNLTEKERELLDHGNFGMK